LKFIDVSRPPLVLVFFFFKLDRFNVEQNNSHHGFS